MVCRVNGPRIREPGFRQRQSQNREGIRGFGFGGGLGESHKIASVPGSRMLAKGCLGLILAHLPFHRISPFSSVFANILISKLNNTPTEPGPGRSEGLTGRISRV